MNNISKIIERLFLSRFYPHVISSPNFNHLQSAYRPHHSTETALLQTFDDIFCSADRSQPTLLVSLDLSAPFDTIDHSTLLSRLATSFGVSGAALAWLTSYLTNRTQTVRIGSVTSEPSICLSGVPQGFVFGPILFSLFISPIGRIVSDFGISHQQYADDAQLYISLKSATAGTSISNLETCLSTLHSWLCLTAFPSIQTNQKPYSLAHINGFELSLPHPQSTYLTPWLSFLIKLPVSVSSWIQISLSMLILQHCAKPVIFISDHFDTSGARSLTTWLSWLLLR